MYFRKRINIKIRENKLHGLCPLVSPQEKNEILIYIYVSLSLLNFFCRVSNIVK